MADSVRSAVLQRSLAGSRERPRCAHFVSIDVSQSTGRASLRRAWNEQVTSQLRHVCAAKEITSVSSRTCAPMREIVGNAANASNRMPGRGRAAQGRDPDYVHAGALRSWPAIDWRGPGMEHCHDGEFRPALLLFAVVQRRSCWRRTTVLIHLRTEYHAGTRGRRATVPFRHSERRIRRPCRGAADSVAETG